MQALVLPPSAPGIATMQSINVTVINPWFMAVVFGPGLAGGLLMLSTFKQGQQPGAIDWLLGSVLYLIEMIGVTMVGNIPLNDALAIANPTSTQGAALWLEYLTDWTVWNHVRTIAAFFAAALLSLLLCAGTGLSVW